MIIDYKNYWESCWQGENAAQLQNYLASWKNYNGKEIEGCGFEKITGGTDRAI